MTRFPTVFVGHGNPMNALADNAFTRALSALGRRLGKPTGVVCVSAHWTTEGTWVTHMRRPKTIHDFHGFPKALFDVRYPAPGSPELAERVRATVESPSVQLDDRLWGLDHGAWSVLRHLYPEADVPVVQLSVYMSQPGAYHLELGRSLGALRDESVLVLGSGNIVHNLRAMDWEDPKAAYDWAKRFDAWVQGRIDSREFEALAGDVGATPDGRLSVPTPDHYYPLLYVLGASANGDKARVEFEGIENGSISMRAVSFSA